MAGEACKPRRSSPCLALWGTGARVSGKGTADMSVISSLAVGRRCSVTVTPDELLAALRRGEDEAYRRIAENELDGLYLLAYRMLGNRAEAEDVCQEVLTKLYQAAPTLRSGTVVRAWLRRVCVNCCLNLRRRRRSRAHPDPYAEITEDLPAPGGTEETVTETAFRTAVDEALQHLSPRRARHLCLAALPRVQCQGNRRDHGVRGGHGEGPVFTRCCGCAAYFKIGSK